MDILDILPTELRLKVQDCLINSKRMVVGKVIGKGMLPEVKRSQGVVCYQRSNITGKGLLSGIKGHRELSEIKGHRKRYIIKDQRSQGNNVIRSQEVPGTGQLSRIKGHWEINVTKHQRSERKVCYQVS